MLGNLGKTSPATEIVKSVSQPLAAAAAFSGLLNLMMLTGSLFMLQVYDRVLPSRSVSTLFALLLIVCAIYAAQSVLEMIRSRLFARIGRHLDLRFGPAAFDAHLGQSMAGDTTQTALKDLEQLRTFMSGLGPAAIFDLPWTPLYVALLFLLHPVLGVIGVAGGGTLIFLTYLADRASRPVQRQCSSLSGEAGYQADQARRNIETIVPLGMVTSLRDRWMERNISAGTAVLRGSDNSILYAGVSRFVRMALQSGMLAAGAWLVLQGKATGGVMIASSILLGRALSPVELAISQWRGFVQARQAADRLGVVLEQSVARRGVQVILPRPSRTLVAEKLTVTPKGAQVPVVHGVSLTLSAGDGLGVVGLSGSGKSTLLRALVGADLNCTGSVRLDGSTLSQWPADTAGGFVGYLPQQAELFSGSVGENIARFQPGGTSEAVLAAAEAAGAASFIRGLPGGFEFQVGDRGGRLSAGQRQLIGLARALYGDPFLLVLDEPNSALDADGELACQRAIAAARKRGAVVAVAVHRPSALQVLNKVLVMRDGTMQMLGPRDEVLKKLAGSAPGGGKSSPSSAGARA